MARHTVCKLGDLPVGGLVPATVGRARIIVSRLPGGEVKAYAGRCPHQGASLEYGCITDLVVEGERPHDLDVDTDCPVLRCPWHGYEFSLDTGQAVVANGNGKFLRLRHFDVEIDGEEVIVVT